MADARAAAQRVADAAAADDASAGIAAGRGATLTVLTWNVQLLAVSVGTPEQLAERASKLAARVLKLSPDVLCLQELFDARARAVLLQALAPSYNDATVFAPADDARCGLVIAARSGLQLRGTAFHRYAGARGAESWLFDKGAAGALLVLPARDAQAKTGSDSDVTRPGAPAEEGTKASCVVIVNTHTQSDYWSPGGRCDAALGRLARAAPLRVPSDATPPQRPRGAGA